MLGTVELNKASQGKNYRYVWLPLGIYSRSRQYISITIVRSDTGKYHEYVCCHVLLRVQSMSNYVTGNIRVIFSCTIFVTMVIADFIIQICGQSKLMCKAKIG